MAQKLRAVGPEEKAERPKSVTEAAESGTQRELLIAMRNRVARAVEDSQTAPRDLAALTKRLADLAGEISRLDAQAAEEVTAVGTDRTRKPFDSSAV